MIYYRDLGKKEYVEEFLKNGKIMISNLYRYKNLENNNRRDQLEGNKAYVSIVNPVERSYPLKINGQNSFNEKNELLTDITLYRTIEIANSFCLSMSTKATNNETCIKIKDIETFRKLISIELHKKYGIGECLSAECLYFEGLEEDESHVKNMDLNYFEKIHKNPNLSIFLKNRKFEHENEYRIAWLPLYNGKACIKIFTRQRKYGYKEHEITNYYPNYLNDFPTKQEMISTEPIFIENKNLIDCI